jgi:hypothetical protein
VVIINSILEFIQKILVARQAPAKNPSTLPPTYRIEASARN